MNLTYQIKAKSKDEAIIKAVKDHNIDKNKIIEIIEISKATSFFGFLKKNGEYKIRIKKTVEVIEIKVEDIVVNKANELLNNMRLVLKVEVLEARDHYVLINLSGDDNGIIIGKKGKTLNSFEYLLNSLCKSVKVEVDVEGFKAKRAETLRDLARKMAEKALNTDKIVKLNPMPPRERKIIHEIVNKYKELDTFSEGRDPKRYIVIKRKKMG